jgi:hypothetical protein
VNPIGVSSMHTGRNELVFLLNPTSHCPSTFGRRVSRLYLHSSGCDAVLNASFGHCTVKSNGAGDGVYGADDGDGVYDVYGVLS